MTDIDLKRDTEHTHKSQELVLSFTSNEEIIQFNKECEQLTGYQRDEVIHRKLSDILLPSESLESWKTHIDSIRQTLCINEFILPIKTKHNQVCDVVWNGFLIKDANGSLKDICLFGKQQKIDTANTQTTPVLQTIVPPQKEEKTYSPAASPIQDISNMGMSIKHEKKKILFAKEKETRSEPIQPSLQENLIQPLENIEKTVENTSEKLDFMNRSLKELSKRVGELEKKDRRLEKKHKNLGKHVRLLEDGTRRYTRKQKRINLGHISFAEQPLQNKKYRFFSDPFGLRQQHRELNARIQQIETRESQLNSFEKQLMNERKTFNTRVEEFCRWREKLELLETAIETRRQELMKQEEALLNQSPTLTPTTDITHVEKNKITKSIIPDSNEFFDTISQSAAIIQRGILKQINSSFAALLGYTTDEVVEKSFFDLIAQDGLADIEKYYLDRLKGEDISVYKTVFSTKDNNKITVEVSIKQTMYNGEKAEIAIINFLEKTKQQSSDK